MEKSRISCGKDNNKSRTDTTTMVSIKRMLIRLLVRSNLVPYNSSNNFLTKEDKRWIKTGRKSTVIPTTKTLDLITRTSRIATRRAKTNPYLSMSASETAICRQAWRISATHATSRVSCRPCFISPIFRKRSWHSTSKISLKISKT